MKSVAYTLVVFAMLGLGACQAAPLAPESATSIFTSPVASPEAGAFVSPIAVLSPIAMPTTEIIGQPAVTGVLLRAGETPAPVGGVPLYLAEVHFDDDGTPLVAGLDKQTAPRTHTDAEGRFAFAAPPGTYALTLDLIHDAVLLNDPVTGEDMLITVQEGETVNLGDLVYSSLPGEGPLP